MAARGVSLVLAALALSCFLLSAAAQGMEDDEDVDLELLLDVLRRTRGQPQVRRESSWGAWSDLLQAHGRRTTAREGARRGGKEKAATELSQKSSQQQKSSRFRKDSSDPESLRTRDKYQRVQADRIRTAYRDGKAQVRLLSATDIVTSSSISWDVPCALKFYQDAYGIVQGCTPSTARQGVCSRIVVDEFGEPDEMRDLAIATEAAMVNLFHQGGSTSLAPVSSLERLGVKGGLLVQYFLAKVKLRIMREFGLEVIYDSGALLTRLKGDPPRDEWDVEPGHVYWNPHVDKANIPTYDYSALLYLNTHGKDFHGGEFSFIDDDADRIVQPRAGRLLIFTSGPENLHQVREVTRGTRYVLAMWFTCSKEDQYRDED
ncbi:hypothetical protein GUITHDRAFT_146036 [Guillardia theta CCMP2712]|uniref:Fe2OG dioxygenase domain-containing protein n=2 Tax=Guillardia theta TaxID=55529 RepID=L1IJW7_GUITC|nr:hypothetical protein GUITHDRAFT_146036 [Guillardia theta CCMP2712]EKX36100.1 hypothetical protein GUITHDRAFT_146036 [Guillardia theta CCMP2712]|mmetsp:Transcript_28317/g.91645  ORF Transcript_28317/g.91645 Transcript_28317/m.91645 type:complete len:375 (+) Transcript_28317:152-1276(+)|eukprot:XP_005823080.1 hypothetical protein GUITHDRAFT_146036 [Guillardia theta CCMP2712]